MTVYQKVSPVVLLRVLKRAKYLCESCGQYNPNLTIHHKIKKETFKDLEDSGIDIAIKASLNDENNIQVLCVPCHRRLHKKESDFTLDEIRFLLKLMHNKGEFNLKKDLVPKLINMKAMIKRRNEKPDYIDDAGDDDDVQEV